MNQDRNGENVEFEDESVEIIFYKLHRNSALPQCEKYFWNVFCLPGLSMVIPQKAKMLVRTGVCVKVPSGYCGYLDGVFVDRFNMVKTENQIIYSGENKELKVWIENLDEYDFPLRPLCCIGRMSLLKVADTRGFVVDLVGV